MNNKSEQLSSDKEEGRSASKIGIIFYINYLKDAIGTTAEQIRK